MADEFVSTAQFGEFVKRIDQRFDHMDKELVNVNKLADQRYESLNQRLADADKAREQNLVHINQRFDDMNARFGDMNARFGDMDRSINQRFDEVNRRFVWMMLLFSPMLIAILGLVAIHWSNWCLPSRSVTELQGLTPCPLCGVDRGG